MVRLLDAAEPGVVRALRHQRHVSHARATIRGPSQRTTKHMGKQPQVDTTPVRARTASTRSSPMDRSAAARPWTNPMTGQGTVPPTSIKIADRDTIHERHWTATARQKFHP